MLTTHATNVVQIYGMFSLPAGGATVPEHCSEAAATDAKDCEEENDMLFWVLINSPRGLERLIDVRMCFIIRKLDAITAIPNAAN